MCIFQVGKTMKTKEADYALEAINNLAQIVPEIWVNKSKDTDVQQIGRTKSEIDFLSITAVGA